MKGIMDNINTDPFVQSDFNDPKVYSHKRVQLFITRIVAESSLTINDLNKLWLSIFCQIKKENLLDYTKFLIEQL